MIEQKEFFETDNITYKVTTISPETKNLKWNIHINQKAIIENNIDIDLIDASIFDFIYDFMSSGNAQQVIIDNQIYHWVSYQYIIDAMPLLRITNKDTIWRHIMKLIKVGLLERKTIKDFGNKTFFKIGGKAKQLFFSQVTTQIKEPSDSNQGTLPTQIKDNSYINNTDINTNILSTSNEVNRNDNLQPTFKQKTKKEPVTYFKEKSTWAECIDQWERFYKLIWNSKMIWNPIETKALKNICVMLNNHFDNANLCFAEIFGNLYSHWKFKETATDRAAPTPKNIQGYLNDIIRV